MPPSRAAYDPERFRRQGHRVIDLLAEHLARAADRQGPVLPWRAPDELLPEWENAFTGVGDAEEGALVELLARTVAGSNHLHHPRYIGHQVTAPLPELALCRLTGALLNNGMAVYEMGPAATAMERQVVTFMAKVLGLPEGADGILTNGGSMGNLTALLAARQVAAGHDVWQEGAHAGPPLALLVASTAHYSIARSVQIMGWGAGGAIPVPVDDRFRLRPSELAEAKRRAEAAGRKVIAVCASAGSTSTGAYDPIEPVADFCAREGLWLHVDGAHGAAVALSPRHRHLIAGIERADSVVWDAHKMMLVPALATAVLFRDSARSYAPFAQQASYLLAEGERPWWDLAARTLECTKRMIGLDIYAALAIHGAARIGEYVADCYDRAAAFAERLAALPDFEAVPPMANIVCFRICPPGVTGEARDALQDRIRERLVREGEAYLVRTRLPDGVYLRITLINPLTTDADLEDLVARIRRAAAS
jgi:L-2,4-diaminobutyrate decarboxylase